MSKVFNIELASIAACAQVAALADGAVSAAVEFIARALGDKPTFEQYEAMRLEWRGAYMTQRDLSPTDSKTANALDRAWSRCVLEPMKAEYEFTIPKSAKPDAAKKAAQREVPEAVAKAETVKALEAIKLPKDDKVAAAKLEAQIADKKAKLVKAEARTEEKAIADAQKNLLDGFIKWIKTDATNDERVACMAVREHDWARVVTLIPSATLQRAVAKINKAKTAATA